MRKLLIVTILLMGALVPQLVIAQAQVPVFGDGPIPDEPFKTWSLFGIVSKPLFFEEIGLTI